MNHLSQKLASLKNKLRQSSHRGRYLQELDEHKQDLDDVKKLGDERELITLYNAYILRKRVLSLTVPLVIGIIACFPSAFLSYTDTPYNIFSDIMNKLATEFDVMGSLTIVPASFFPTPAFPIIRSWNIYPVLTGLAWAIYIYFMFFSSHPNHRLIIIATFTVCFVLEGLGYPNGAGYFIYQAATFSLIIAISLAINFYRRRSSLPYADQ